MDKLTKLRISIAKDVLKWITKDNVSSNTGYCTMDDDPAKFAGDSKKAATRLKKICMVCAQGGLLLSLVAKCNAFDFSDAFVFTCENRDVDNAKLRARLTAVFNLDQLNLIESAFETRWQYIVSINPHAQHARARAFSARYKTDLGRMRGIMKNIIKNEGTFKP